MIMVFVSLRFLYFAIKILGKREQRKLGHPSLGMARRSNQWGHNQTWRKFYYGPFHLQFSTLDAEETKRDASRVI